MTKKTRTPEQKAIDKMREEIQKKLKKFATRIPVFMYMSDKREESLKDVILKFEPELFVKATGIEISEFKILLDLNVFNKDKMNLAVLAFKRFEDSSLMYTGIAKHKDLKRIGAFSKTISIEEYKSGSFL